MKHYHVTVLSLFAFFSASLTQTLLADSINVQLGPRPFYLLDKLKEGPLKSKLNSCSVRNFQKSDFSISHRGAPLQFPEHTKESYVAGARMGAGILECDVTFTKDKELVCRHSQCDLATTTNILLTPLAKKCSKPFQPAEFDKDGKLVKPASAQCCTSDITLAEFKTLKGKMDAFDKKARTKEEFVGGTAKYRTDLYATGGTLLSHKESIELFKKLNVMMTPELKSASVQMPFEGTYTQEKYAQQLINEYKQAGVSPEQVFAQSFNKKDVLYWIKNEKYFGKQAVYLDNRVYKDEKFKPSLEDMKAIKEQGINIIAPPLYALLKLDGKGNIEPSEYAIFAQKAGLDIITWTTERSGRILEDVKQGGGNFYYKTTLNAIENDGDILRTIDVLARKVKVLGIFSDWPATTTYYANCMKLK